MDHYRICIFHLLYLYICHLQQPLFGEKYRLAKLSVPHSNEEMDTMVTCKFTKNIETAGLIIHRHNSFQVMQIIWDMKRDNHWISFSFWSKKFRISRNISTQSLHLSFASPKPPDDQFRCLGLNPHVDIQFDPKTSLLPKVQSITIIDKSGPVTRAIYPGEEVTLKCSIVMGSPEILPNIIELKSPGKSSNDIHSYTIGSSGKFTIREYISNHTYRPEDDRKEVYCSAIYWAVKSEEKMKIRVYSQPRGTRISFSRDSVGTELFCECEGNPIIKMSIQNYFSYQDIVWRRRFISGRGKVNLTIPHNVRLGPFKIICQARKNFFFEFIKALGLNTIVLSPL